MEFIHALGFQFSLLESMEVQILAQPKKSGSVSSTVIRTGTTPPQTGKVQPVKILISRHQSQHMIPPLNNDFLKKEILVPTLIYIPA
ncbi:hypothetical protein [Rubritalea tangerina]|uniref:hypothetical protein n=1 Tax=Rubritalea tangerina TaxID=430798 RepID=UPI0036159128